MKGGEVARRNSRRSSLLFVASLLLVFCTTGVLSGKDKRRTVEPYGLIVVSVFRDPGFAFPGVKVTLTPVRTSQKAQEQEGNTDSRGEIAFRVPPGPAEFKVRAEKRGFRTEEKVVSLAADERVDVFLVLKPEGDK